MMYSTSTWVIQFAMYLESPFHMLTGPIFLIFNPSMSLTILLNQTFTASTTDIIAVSINQFLSAHQAFFSAALLNHRSSACSSGCQAFNNTWTHVPSCPSSPLSPRSLRREAVNLSEMLSVLSAVYWLTLLYPGCILMRPQTPWPALCGLLADLTI